jgi:hypothetical protein
VVRVGANFKTAIEKSSLALDVPFAIREFNSNIASRAAPP